MPISNFSSSELVMFGLGSVLIGVIIIAIIVSRLNLRQKLSIEIEADERARHNDYHINALLQAQAEMQGRMQTMAELFGTRQAELNHAIGERLDGLSQHLGQSIGQQTRTTHENLVRLQERLAVIDRAQNNIQTLAGQVVELQSILSNKQTRGAFGQGRMEAIISDALPPTSYKFQATLSNGTRPDCVIYLPNAAPHLVIDAKFPLEAWNAMREATTDELRQRAEQRFRTDMDVHIRDISQKYLISGETQDTAFMFVPSESIFATIHETFESIVEKANRARVIIVSPSLLLLAIDVVQQVLKDARMREQAHLIQAEVWALMQDLNRLDERVRKLQSHFQMAEKDVDDILISSSKLLRRGSRIEALELGEIKHNKPPDDGLPSDSLL
ncbi:DNA recombination protein RmuC [Bartonella sp. HY329]|uniref:DNA recombination protein RmuC n=1 Tax=unclassified Bartonella TaxID=2645622 RepID=UPI0021C6F5B6|nr:MULTISPECIES: DNA recombination protein RmuC [unclassified Bartonella]UXM94481.1 DNA recombination protein RmuC [Bartonella sp. HY329]UXN08805.1 DNA recombination protein RmuC [Bartonella sp. HY328]